MRRYPCVATIMALSLLGVLLLTLPAFVLAQPRPQVLPLHTAEAGASANGATVPTLGYEAVAVQNTIAAAWDGTLTLEVTTDNANWTAITCRNALSTVTASTIVAAAGYVVCPVTGAQGFRARVSGRTVGTVTAVAALIPMSGSGLSALVPPVGAAATQVQGTANDGAAEVGNPVQVGGVDGAGNMQAWLAGTDGRQDMNVGQINGVTPLMGNGITGTGSPRVTVASDNTAFTVNVGTFPDNEPFNLAQVGGAATLVGNGITGTGSPRVTIASDNTAFTVNVGTFPDNEPFNVAQFGGAAVVTGTGAGGAGIPRVTMSNDSSLAANQSVNVSQVNGVTPLMGAGVTGTGSPRVSFATDANTIQISQTTPATTNGVTPVPTTNAAAANALTSSGAAQASNVLKASAGNLYSLTITTGATAGYLMIFNATSAPIDGAVTPAYCSQAPANMTSAIEWSIPVRFGTGVTAVFSTTGCFTKTESATAAFFAQVN